MTPPATPSTPGNSIGLLDRAMPFFRMLGYVSASMVSISLIVGFIVSSWIYAHPANTPRQRLRWHMITKTAIPRGKQIKEDDVTWTLGRTSDDQSLSLLSKTVVGKYALTDIKVGSNCIPSSLSDLAPADPPENGAAVPVEVKTSDAASLLPNMRLAFVQDKTMLPSYQKGSANQGLLLLSITRSEQEPTTTSLIVKIEEKDMTAVPLLGSGLWRPIILSKSEAETKH